MTETGTTEWRRHMQRDREESSRRRAARAALRREMAKRRKHGLEARQTIKLIRRDLRDEQTP